MFTEEVFCCACHDFSHSMRFMYFTDNYDHDPLYLDVNLFHSSGFWSRLYGAMRYIRYNSNTDCLYDVFTFCLNDIDRLIKVLDNYIETYHIILDENEIKIVDNKYNIENEDNVVEFLVENDSIGEDDYLNFAANKYLKREKSVWKRAKKGIRFIFGYKSRYGAIDDFELKLSDACTLRFLAKIAKEDFTNDKLREMID